MSKMIEISIKKFRLSDMTRLLNNNDETKCYTCNFELHLGDWVVPKLDSRHQMKYRHVLCAYRVGIINEIPEGIENGR